LGLVLQIGLLPHNGLSSKILPSIYASGHGDRYDDDNNDDSKQDKTSNHQKTTKHTQLSGAYDGYSGSLGIAVKEDITQTNVCSSDIAYCDNEIDNDFHVNPP
jgi:predicted DNA-binding helix-hairpin-helix protein